MRFLALVCWLLALPAAAQDHVRSVGARVHPIERFHPFSGATRFGRLEFLGGLHVASSDPLFGGWSGVRMLGERMVAISDAGYWFDARLLREGGRLVGLRGLRVTPMLDENGNRFRYKAEIDAEGFAYLPAGAYGKPPVLLGAAWIVSTERDIRLLRFEGDPFGARPARSRLATRPAAGLRGNRALEAVALRVEPSPASVVTFSEDTRDPDGNIVGFVLLKKELRPLVVRKRGRFGITDAAFLPDGDLLLLERRFDLAAGHGLRIRRIAGGTIRPGAVLDGEVLIEVGLPHQIDNMEGLAVSPHPRGHRLTLVSDDNRSLLQRTLVLEFLLEE